MNIDAATAATIQHQQSVTGAQKAQDQQEVEGQAAVKLIEAATPPSQGDPDVGTRLDVQA